MLISPEEALSRILKDLRPLPAEWCELSEAFGRVIPDEVKAVRTLPPSDNSAMDGYAVRSEDLAQGARSLDVVEKIHAGQQPTKTVSAGQCARIMTGAPMPEGADAVVMQEKTREISPTRVQVLEKVGPRTNVRDRGEDAREGQPLLAARTPLGVPEVGLLWAQGFSRAQVHARPRVAIASTGDELVKVGIPHEGKIVDTNSPSLAAMVRRAGGEPTLLGIAPDEPGAVRELLGKGTDGGFDVLITSAGVSVGDKDYARTCLEELGVQMDFWKIAIKPGKPLAFGRKGKTLVFGLPGNPASSLVTFELFVLPALRALQGYEQNSTTAVSGRLTSDFKKAAGLRHFVRVTTQWKDGDLWATPLATQTSGALRSAAGSGWLFSAAPDRTVYTAGEKVVLIPTTWAARFFL